MKGVQPGLHVPGPSPLTGLNATEKQGEPVNAWCKQCDTQGFQCLLDVVLLRGLHSL